MKEALENGTLTIERWKSYEKLLKESKYSAKKASYLKQKTNAYKSATKSQHISTKK